MRYDKHYAALLMFLMGAPLQAQQPSLQETTSWLTDKLPLVHREYRGTLSGDPYQTQLRIEGVSFSGCQMTFKQVNKTVAETSSGAQTFRTELLYDVALGELSLDITVTTRLGGGDETPREEVLVSAPSAIGKEIRVAVTDDHGQKTSKTAKGVYFILNAEDQSLADRISKALSNAVRLCGGRKEPF